MMMNSRQVACIALLGSNLLPSQANSNPLPDYQCTVERVSAATSRENKSEAELQHVSIGSQFTVERRTGRMVGKLKNTLGSDPEIIDLGSSTNSYKVVTIVRLKDNVGFTDIQALVVTEWDASPQFVFLSNYITYFGSCVHF
jgi:hypothetical protein